MSRRQPGRHARLGRLGGLAAALLMLLLAPEPASSQQVPPPGGAPGQGAAPADVPSGPATLRVRVVEATDGEPVPDTPVILYALSREGVPGLRRGTTDAEGAFVFEGISNSGDVAYLVGARYRGVPYPGERVLFDGDTERRAEIRVAPVTADPGAVRLVERRLSLDPSAGRLAVEEVLVLENRGDATYYVAQPERGAGRPALRTRLAAGARDFQMPLGVVPEGVERDGERLRFFGPVYPGRQELSWQYALDPADSAEGTSGLRSDRFEWRAPVADDAAPLLVELPAGGTRIEAAGGRLEEIEAAAGEEASALRRLRARPPESGPLALVVRTPPARVAPDAVRPVEARLVVHPDPAAIEVTETHVLEVRGDGPVRGAAGEPLHRIALPEDARNLRFGSDARSLSLRPDPEVGGLAVTGVLPAGESRVEMAYRLPVRALPTILERRFVSQLPLLSVFLADRGDLVVQSDRLHRRRPVRTAEVTYAHLEAFEVEPGEPVRLSIAIQPPRADLPRQALLAVGLVLAGLAIGFLLTPVWRARVRGRLEPEDTADPVTRERELVYETIRDLDHDFETGKVSEEDHRRLREELRARAARLLARERAATGAAGGAGGAAPDEAERDAGAGAAPPAPRPEAPAACAGCGAAPRPGDRFCASCGAPLAGAAAASPGDPGSEPGEEPDAAASGSSAGR